MKVLLINLASGITSFLHDVKNPLEFQVYISQTHSKLNPH